jgi:hypothetical protein
VDARDKRGHDESEFAAAVGIIRERGEDDLDQNDPKSP